MARPPEQLGSFRLVRQLGVGRKFQIWEAADESQSKRVAVKLVSPESASDKSIRQLLKHELIVSKSLNHPGIIQMERYSTAGQLPHLVMELFRHPNLKMRLTSGGESIADRAQLIAHNAADAISHLHTKRWVHRDIKPENLLITAQGTVKVSDFGIAHVEDAGHSFTKTGAVLGTVGFMSPEQQRSAKGLTPQTDFADFLAHASTQRTFTQIIRRNSRSVSETFNFCVTRRLLIDLRRMELLSVQYVKSRKALVAALSSQDLILNGGWKLKVALHSFTMSQKS